MALLRAPESTQKASVKQFFVDGRVVNISILEQLINEGSCNVYEWLFWGEGARWSVKLLFVYYVNNVVAIFDVSIFPSSSSSRWFVSVLGIFWCMFSGSVEKHQVLSLLLFLIFSVDHLLWGCPSNLLRIHLWCQRWWKRIVHRSWDGCWWNFWCILVVTCAKDSKVLIRNDNSGIVPLLGSEPLVFVWWVFSLLVAPWLLKVLCLLNSFLLFWR